MKKFILLSALFSLFLTSCSKSDRGELVGAKGKKWHPEKPYGMTLVPGGAFVMGKSDDDFLGVADAPTKTLTVRSFYMDETEITNSEYRQFVDWVKDSVIRTKLAIKADELGMNSEGSGGQGSIGAYAFANVNEANMSPYDKYMYENYYSISDNEFAGRRLNKKVKLIQDPQKYPDEHYVEVMDTMYLPESESYNGLRTIDVSKLNYRYTQMDIDKAAKDKSTANSRSKRSQYVKTEILNIYPDTTVWIKDFAYSYNEPMHNDYFWHEAYGDYPVVGVNWYQARAFCSWRTMYKNSYLKKKKGRNFVNSFRLPLEAEWEFAARGGLEGATYPWGGPYTLDERGCYLANFKPVRGDYAADGALYTVAAKSYSPNGYNLYNMSGNVAEWTHSSYQHNSFEFSSTMNPDVSDPENRRKVVRGGSWKDIAYYLQVGTRYWEYADTSRSYIGFRTVQDYMGTQTTGNSPQ